MDLKIKERSKRAKRMTQSEINILVEEVVNNHEVLFGKLNNNVTKGDKSQIWSNIAERMLSQGPIDEGLRSDKQLQQKIADLKSELKKKLSDRNRHMRQTGAGPLPYHLILTDLEEKLSIIIGNVEVSGIGDGLETGVTEDKNDNEIILIDDHSYTTINCVDGEFITADIDTTDTQEELEIMENTPIIKKRKYKDDQTVRDKLVKVEEERNDILRKQNDLLKILIDIKSESNKIEKQKLELKLAKNETLNIN